jgi:glutamate/tyrosine decarboxylase-like PLP-dependent enzyme
LNDLGEHSSVEELLSDASERACRYLEGLSGQRVFPGRDELLRLSRFGEALPENGVTPSKVLALLDECGSPATVASAGGRYFGFVTGGSLPIALAAQWLAAAWDQNACLRVMSPVSARIEDITNSWLRDLFGLSDGWAVGFVTGATMANFSALAAARHALLARLGWDVEAQGLFGAPSLRVVVGEDVHVSMLKALALAGFGRSRVEKVPIDAQGRMRADELPPLDARTIVCAQVGNVNTGACDPIDAICERSQEAGAWVHVDGAFGLWARASSRRAHLVRGIEHAQSLAMDCHKWLNVPYDCGVVFVRDEPALRAAMSLQAAYLPSESARQPGHYVPDASRRARAIEVWAALLSLGKRGLDEMIERSCRLAARFADGLLGGGAQILNEVVLNQVLVSFGTDDRTKRVINAVQEDGTCWCGGTEWRGSAAMRISVSCWATTEDDIDASIAAILHIASSVA